MTKEKNKAYYYFISGFTAFLVAAMGVYATTIGDSISVTGTLTSSGAATMSSTLAVTGATTLTGAATLSSTLDVTGNSTLASADIGGAYSAGGGSGTTITAAGKGQFNGDLEINGFATTTASNGNFASQGTIGVGTSTPWGTFSSEMGTTNPSFVVSNNGSTTPALIVGGVNQDGRVGIASTTPSNTLGVEGNAMFISAATTTITISSTGAVRGGCIQMENGAGTTMYRIYVVGAGNALRVEAGACSEN